MSQKQIELPQLTTGEELKVPSIISNETLIQPSKDENIKKTDTVNDKENLFIGIIVFFFIVILIIYSIIKLFRGISFIYSKYKTFFSFLWVILIILIIYNLIL